MLKHRAGAFKTTFTNVKHVLVRWSQDEANKMKAREKSLREHAETLAEISFEPKCKNFKRRQIKNCEEVNEIKSSMPKTGLKMAVIRKILKKLYIRGQTFWLSSKKSPTPPPFLCQTSTSSCSPASVRGRSSKSPLGNTVNFRDPPQAPTEALPVPDVNDSIPPQAATTMSPESPPNVPQTHRFKLRFRNLRR